MSRLDLDAAGVVANVGEAKRKVCRVKVRRAVVAFRRNTFCIAEKYIFLLVRCALSYDQLRTKLEKCLWERDGWIDQSLADFTSTLKIGNRVRAPLPPSAGHFTFHHT